MIEVTIDGVTLSSHNGHQSEFNDMISVPVALPTATIQQWPQLLVTFTAH